MYKRYPVLWFFCCLIFLQALPLTAYGADGQIKIAQTADTAFPIVISQPGSYVLTSNLTVNAVNTNAITITANNVTLDLNGHSIDGPSSGSGDGIYALNRSNISIKNGVITEFEYGIYLYDLPSYRGGGHRIAVISTRRNLKCGILIFYGTVSNCTADNNGQGIEAHYSSVTGCTASYNGGFGSGIGVYVIESTVSNCTAHHNHAGISAVNASVTDSAASSNETTGIYCIGSVSNCTAYANSGNGIYCQGPVNNSSSTDNGEDGIFCIKGAVTDCNVVSNGANGINAYNSVVRGCNVRDNNGRGIENYLPSGYTLARNYIYRNVVGENSGGQINCGTNSCVDNYLP